MAPESRLSIGASFGSHINSGRTMPDAMARPPHRGTSSVWIFRSSGTSNRRSGAATRISGGTSTMVTNSAPMKLNARIIGT